jgi:hypothetical protein
MFSELSVPQLIQVTNCNEDITSPQNIILTNIIERFEVLTVASMKCTVFQDVTPYSLVDHYFWRSILPRS